MRVIGAGLYTRLFILINPIKEPWRSNYIIISKNELAICCQ